MIKTIYIACSLCMLLPLHAYSQVGIFSPINGIFAIRSASTGKCLGTTPQSLNTGLLQQVDCNINDESQLWQLLATGHDKEYQLISNQTAQCVDGTTATPKLATCDLNIKNQSWILHFPSNNGEQAFSLWHFRFKSAAGPKCLAIQTLKEIDNLPKLAMSICDNGNNLHFTFIKKIQTK